jgi:hypothetical protein
MHRHHWKTITYLLLGLPRLGHAERLMQWQCACGEWCSITGDVHVGTPLHTPAWWQGQQNEEQRRGTPEARVAWRAQQQRCP